jgi:hypothetical protein
MGIFEDMSKALSPHADRLNGTIHLQGALLHTRLGGIERALSDLGRPDVGDLWVDLGVNATVAALAPKELITIQMNEALQVQSIVAQFPGSKEQQVINIRANRRLRAALQGEKTASFFPGGNISFLPGEAITIESLNEAAIEVTITCIRRGLQVRPAPANTGVSGERDASLNTHDPARDIIQSRTGEYQELASEVRDTGGSPPLTRLSGS